MRSTLDTLIESSIREIIASAILLGRLIPTGSTKGATKELLAMVDKALTIVAANAAILNAIGAVNQEEAAGLVQVRFRQMLQHVSNQVN